MAFQRKKPAAIGAKAAFPGFVEPALATALPGEPIQFERQGYFCPDLDSAPNRLIFNRTVGLRDSWTKMQAIGAQG